MILTYEVAGPIFFRWFRYLYTHEPSIILADLNNRCDFERIIVNSLTTSFQLNFLKQNSSHFSIQVHLIINTSKCDIRRFPILDATCRFGVGYEIRARISRYCLSKSFIFRLVQSRIDSDFAFLINFAFLITRLDGLAFVFRQSRFRMRRGSSCYDIYLLRSTYVLLEVHHSSCS